METKNNESSPWLVASRLTDASIDDTQPKSPLKPVYNLKRFHGHSVASAAATPASAEFNQKKMENEQVPLQKCENEGLAHKMNDASRFEGLRFGSSMSSAPFSALRRSSSIPPGIGNVSFALSQGMTEPQELGPLASSLANNVNLNSEGGQHRALSVSNTTPSALAAMPSKSPRAEQTDPENQDSTEPRLRKPYTKMNRRESWSAQEHEKFVQALQEYGRKWKSIQKHVDTKTVQQIMSHAQKYFQKIAKEKPETLQEIPPPRPKKKASRPYPRNPGKQTDRSSMSQSPYPGNSRNTADSSEDGETYASKAGFAGTGTAGNSMIGNDGSHMLRNNHCGVHPLSTTLFDKSVSVGSRLEPRSFVPDDIAVTSNSGGHGADAHFQHMNHPSRALPHDSNQIPRYSMQHSAEYRGSFPMIVHSAMRSSVSDGFNTFGTQEEFGEVRQEYAYSSMHRMHQFHNSVTRPYSAVNQMNFRTWSSGFPPAPDHEQRVEDPIQNRSMFGAVAAPSPMNYAESMYFPQMMNPGWFPHYSSPYGPYAYGSRPEFANELSEQFQFESVPSPEFVAWSRRQLQDLRAQGYGNPMQAEATSLELLQRKGMEENAAVRRKIRRALIDERKYSRLSLENRAEERDEAEDDTVKSSDFVHTAKSAHSRKQSRDDPDMAVDVDRKDGQSDRKRKRSSSETGSDRAMYPLKQSENSHGASLPKKKPEECLREPISDGGVSDEGDSRSGSGNGSGGASGFGSDPASSVELLEKGSVAGEGRVLVSDKVMQRPRNQHTNPHTRPNSALDSSRESTGGSRESSPGDGFAQQSTSSPETNFQKSTENANVKPSQKQQENQKQAENLQRT
mmetsp:Transcript_790/g.1449  ORF Transcript_790/g.1449 Transcript_790/m.1449 type:complete len:847 (-) Transcript_790:1235-3775(-)|eukprot:CAMPEP_0182447448 /NCGR_PEP_ID=MMETSP1172-20130603/16134_1 /TAXON_ID=708627 /ORGANISM="Timspurckia oligopyrenoides, Strain CCMP3278" /LENGTH=846 /DNA_ID=CAMNT_0024643891 /DNA_START=94 /DNA_END=2634 /DNA_ORIENTATION=+